MKADLKADLKSKTFCYCKSFACLREIEISSIDSKLYQKLIVVLIALSTILIFPESPRELEKICESYNSRQLCNVW